MSAAALLSAGMSAGNDRTLGPKRRRDVDAIDALKGRRLLPLSRGTIVCSQESSVAAMMTALGCRSAPR